jgi:hypothetical protein
MILYSIYVKKIICITESVRFENPFFLSYHRPENWLSLIYNAYNYNFETPQLLQNQTPQINIFSSISLMNVVDRDVNTLSVFFKSFEISESGYGKIFLLVDVT